MKEHVEFRMTRDDLREFRKKKEQYEEARPMQDGFEWKGVFFTFEQADQYIFYDGEGV